MVLLAFTCLLSHNYFPMILFTKPCIFFMFPLSATRLRVSVLTVRLQYLEDMLPLDGNAMFILPVLKWKILRRTTVIIPFDTGQETRQTRV